MARLDPKAQKQLLKRNKWRQAEYFVYCRSWKSAGILSPTQRTAGPCRYIIWL